MCHPDVILKAFDTSVLYTIPIFTPVLLNRNIFRFNRRSTVIIKSKFNSKILVWNLQDCTYHVHQVLATILGKWLILQSFIVTQNEMEIFFFFNIAWTVAVNGFFNRIMWWKGNFSNILLCFCFFQYMSHKSHYTI